ncbi:sugar phosphate isomerase/epimerase [Aureibaculum marinum]|uniref:Sugar phosphate isomerase/epimerase n=1 Tax=Aureibaculum marinum TaxID=2487930 RepID=A0A3N4NVR1_9FLAO|nr:sugar phosphate isomerase/epimerase family protein [Aureibaculum marinum]RPE00185.1 sugar phosphate isomerase/epimerase [Aureibaculum marinum]
MIKKILFTLSLILIVSTSITSCKKNTKKTEEKDKTTLTENRNPFFKLSLAQWSLHRAINDKTLNPLDFAQKAKELGFEGIEYVSGLYTEELKNMGMKNLLDSLKAKSDRYNIQNVLIMVDGEGNLATSDENERNEAVNNHKKWVDAAAFLGCHSIRVNLFGATTEEEWIVNATKGLKLLSEYGISKGINIIVENHGGLSSNAALLAQVIKNVDLDNCGTLPDFGNFCLKREGGAQWNAKCIEEYDKYNGTKEMMPFAKGVSAKSYDFDANGNETTLNYARLLQIVKDAGYTGFIGVEYEGSRLSEEKGIQATKELLIKTVKTLD